MFVVLLLLSRLLSRLGPCGGFLVLPDQKRCSCASETADHDDNESAARFGLTGHRTQWTTVNLSTSRGGRRCAAVRTGFGLSGDLAAAFAAGLEHAFKILHHEIEKPGPVLATRLCSMPQAPYPCATLRGSKLGASPN